MNCCDFLAIISTASISSIATTVVVPVLPIELERRHVDPSLTGLIFSAFAVPWVLAPLIMPK